MSPGSADVEALIIIPLLTVECFVRGNGQILLSHFLFHFYNKRNQSFKIYREIKRMDNILLGNRDYLSNCVSQCLTN